MLCVSVCVSACTCVGAHVHVHTRMSPNFGFKDIRIFLCTSISGKVISFCRFKHVLSLLYVYPFQ